MHRRTLLLLLSAAALTAMGGNPAGTGAGGWIDRALLLDRTDAPRGTLDQLSEGSPLPAAWANDPATAWLRARALWQTADPSAQEALDLFIRRWPAATEAALARLLLGDILLARGDYHGALARYEEIHPDAFAGTEAAQLRLHKAVCLIIMGSHAEADALLRDIPADEGLLGQQALFYRAYAAYLDKNWMEAERLFTLVDARAGAPCGEAPFYLMQLAFRQGEFDRAFREARQCLDNSGAYGLDGSQRAEALRVAGESAWQLGRRDEAVTLLWDYLLAADADSEGAIAANACYILGVDEYEKGRADEAVKLMQRAVRSTDGTTMQSAYLYLGQAYRLRGDNDAALMAFEQAVRNNYDRAVEETAYYNTLVTRIDGGTVPFGSGLAMMEDFLEAFPRSEYAPQVRQYVVEGYMTGNDYERALSLIDRSADRDTAPLQAARRRALLMLGSRELTAGHPSAARERLEEAAKLPASDAAVAAQTQLWLAESRLTTGDAAGAATAYRAFLASPQAQGRNAAVAWYGLGYALTEAGKNADAAAAFAKALAYAPAGDADAPWRADMANRQGDALLLLARYADALKAYQRAESENPAAADYAIYSQAVTQGVQRRHAEKVATIDRLLAAFPTTPLAPKALLEKAESLLALDRHAEAIATYNTLIANYPATEAGRNGSLQLALTLLSTGKRQQAVATYKSVVETYPSSPEAAIALDDLKRLSAEDGTLESLGGWLAGIDGAPALNPDEMERLSFEAAEEALARRADTSLLKRHLANYPSGPNASRALGLLAEQAWDEGDAAEAASLAAKSLALSPDGGAMTERALMVKARAESAQGKWNAARSSWKQLEERASDAETLRQARLGRMRAADRLALNDEVIALAGSLLASSAAQSRADDAEVALLQARAQLRKGDTATAWPALEQLAATPGSPEGAEATVTLAKSLLDNGQNARAKSVLDTFINANPPQPYWLARGFIVYSDLLRADGSTFEADEYLRSLRANYPGSEADIREMINDRLK